MADIVVNTYSLRQYADRLDAVNRRIVNLDYRMDLLYGKVGLLGLYKLIQADILTGYSYRLLRCKNCLIQTASEFESIENNLLNENPLSFKKKVSLIQKIEDISFDVGVAVVKKAEEVKSAFKKGISDIVESYDSHGWAYKVVQYGKATVTAIKGVAKIATGVAAIVGTGGMSTPVAILSIISGMNDVYNSTSDALYVYNGEYDKVGQNALKDALVNGGETIGSALGNEKVGEIIGNVTYYGIDIVTSLETLSLSMDKIKQLSSTNFGGLWGELKEIGNTDIGKILTTDLNTLKYETKLASYTFTNTFNLISNIGALNEVAGNTVELGKGMNDIYTSVNPEFENPVINTFDKISNISDFAKGVTGIATSDMGDFINSAKQIDSVFVIKGNESFLKTDIFLNRNFSAFNDKAEDVVNTVKTTIEASTELFN